MNIAHLRLTNQHIADRPFAQADQVVAWLGALQGQGYSGALWAIGLPMRGATEQMIEQALAEPRIVRPWPMRGWGFLAARGWGVRGGSASKPAPMPPCPRWRSSL